MEPVVILLVLAVLLAVVGAVASVATHHSLLRTRAAIEESWRQLDAELRGRHELVAALVSLPPQSGPRAAVTDEVREELAVLGTTASRLSGLSAERAAVEDRLTAVVERLPSGPGAEMPPGAAELMARLAVATDRIAAGRRHHNAQVRVHNARAAAPGTRLVARAGRFEQIPLFEGDPLPSG